MTHQEMLREIDQARALFEDAAAASNRAGPSSLDLRRPTQFLRELRRVVEMEWPLSRPAGARVLGLLREEDLVKGPRIDLAKRLLRVLKLAMGDDDPGDARAPPPRW